MSCVAIRKNKPVDQQPDHVSKVNRTGKPLYVYIENDLEIALNRRLKASRRTKTEEVAIALEEYLAKHGEWPLPEKAKT